MLYIAPIFDAASGSASGISHDPAESPLSSLGPDNQGVPGPPSSVTVPLAECDLTESRNAEPAGTLQVCELDQLFAPYVERLRQLGVTDNVWIGPTFATWAGAVPNKWLVQFWINGRHTAISKTTWAEVETAVAETFSEKSTSGHCQAGLAS